MKKVIAMVLCLAMICSLCACTKAVQEKVQQKAQELAQDLGDHETAAPGTEKTFTVIVVHQDGTTKEFTYTTDEQYVGPVLVAAGLIEGNAGPYGLEITKVDGVKAVYTEDNAYWAVYEGEEYAMQGIDTTPALNGAVYKLVYTVA